MLNAYNTMIRLLFIFLASIAPVISQESLIQWTADRKLNWSDFQGKPDPGNLNAALTSSKINFRFGYGSKGFNYNISCRFDKTQSWVRIRNNHILAHEQGHFDIAEIFARRLSRALKQYHYNEKTVSADVNTIYRKLMEEHHLTQEKYDAETDHSRNLGMQEAWKQKIEEDLQILEPWSKYQ